MKTLTVVITGGGTGGHIFPGIAIAQEMIARDHQTRIVFIGTERRIDKQAMEMYGFDTRTIHCKPLKGSGLWAKLKSIGLLPVSLLESLLVLRNIKPDLVFGVGGYVTGPVLVAARLLGVPTCIHEQNSVPGMANRKIGGVVDRIFLSLPGSERFFPEEKCFLSGNPIRKDILDILAEKQSSNAPTLVVLGGSQGAHSVNRIVPPALDLIKTRLPEGFTVIHQTGVADEEDVRQEYGRIGISARVTAFFSSMKEVYSEATLVLSRAGATTLAELTALQLPMLLIPFPYAADNHQQKNAQILVDSGAAKMFLEADLTPEILSVELLSLLLSEEARHKMAKSSGALARPHAAQAIVDQALTLLRQKEA
nr:undecaprenyldiphospho-muramoylpentapeptide beta-N-acetylglucosaminyltransferase [Desulfobulbaceae bacterium]